MFVENYDTCSKRNYNTGLKRKKLLQKIGKGVIIYNKMMEEIREAIEAGRYKEYKEEKLRRMAEGE